MLIIIDIKCICVLVRGLIELIFLGIEVVGGVWVVGCIFF